MFVLDDSPPDAPSNLVVNGESLGNKRRGSEKCKSYRVEFKKKTLDLLDSLASSKNKYKIVSRERGVHQSLVKNWNKNRSQIFKELELYKNGKNSGNIREARQRKKLVSGRSKQHEKYPLAENLLIVEFKVRRATGCKVRKKMKSKIEMCCGKSEANSFKGLRKDTVWYLQEEK